jgi:Ca-activated chloride channel family protein
LLVRFLNIGLNNNFRWFYLLIVFTIYPKTVFLQINASGAQNFSSSTYNPNTTTRLLFIFDDSFSMNSRWNSGSRIEIAQKLMGEFLDSIKIITNLEIALRCYGHQTPYTPNRNCEDSKLEIPFAPISKNSKLVKERIMKLSPTGTTPIAYSLEQCAKDFPTIDNSKNIVVLITDGIEECNGDPCAISKALQSKNIFLRPFVIGIGLDTKFADAFACMGKFYDVSNESNFKNVLNMILTEALTQTTVQVNLNNLQKKPLETDVTMTFYDQFTGKVNYNYLHTINHRGNPDTIILNPDIKYKMIVHTIPSITKENIALTKGKHNIIDVDAAQGFLNLKFQGPTLKNDVQFLVRKKDDPSTLNVQFIEKSEKYLVGKYDIEVLTLPRIKINAIEIKQSSINTINIPGSGKLQISKLGDGFGSIYSEENNLLTWVYNIGTDNANETIYLQPGNYRAEYRLKTQTDSDKTIERKFKIESGKQMALKLF